MDFQDQSFFPTMLIIIIPFIAIAVIGMSLSKKIIKNLLILDNEIRGLSTISTITGGLFGLVLGLVVVSLWQDYRRMQEKTVKEATIIGVIYKEVEQLQHSESDSIQLLIENYLNAIIKNGWPLMTKGQESIVTRNAFNQLGLFVLNIKVSGSGQEHIKQDILDRMAELYKSRQERLHYASNPRVPEQLWFVLIISAAISISTTFIFPIPNSKTKTLLTVAYSSMIGIILFLMTCLNYPFRGAISISPEAYIKVREGFKILKENEKPLLESPSMFNEE